VGSKAKESGFLFLAHPDPTCFDCAIKQNISELNCPEEEPVFSTDIFSVSHQFYFSSLLDGNVHAAVFFFQNSNKPVDVNNYSSSARQCQGGSFSQNVQFYSSLGAYPLDKKFTFENVGQ